MGVGTCDKGLPAVLIALAGARDLPVIAVPGGVTLPPERGEDAGSIQSAGVRLAQLGMPLLAGLDSANWSGVAHVSGSVLANCELVRESFETELTAKAKRSLSVESPALSAAKGAALMALKKMAPPKVDEVAARLAKRES